MIMNLDRSVAYNEKDLNEGTGKIEDPAKRLQENPYRGAVGLVSLFIVGVVHTCEVVLT